MFKFERMVAWQKAVELADRSFEFADGLQQKLQFSIGEQLRRAALSISNNLAEGSGRRTPALQRNFYDIAKGSTYEVVSVIAIAQRRNLISKSDYDWFYQKGDELASIISGLIDATLREENSNNRTLREQAETYGINELDSTSNSPL